MKKKLLWILAVTSTCFSLPILDLPIATSNSPTHEIFPILSANKEHRDAQEIKALLQRESPALQPMVIEKVLKTIECSNQYHMDHNNIITIIDYSLPSNQKRLWIFDIAQRKLLFNTYVSHGINSGALITNYFSNKYNSKASSIGLYKTEKAYYGREGLSLRLNGLDKNFNDNASNRAIVMHGGWYVEESFIKKYGRPGRSWGCPAVPTNLYQSIINTIKDDSLLVVYYPSDGWFSQSKFLNCGNNQLVKTSINQSKIPINPTADEIREEVLFADMNNNNKRDEYEPVLAMTANNYEKFFYNRPPLERMLRRQVDNMEYIALSISELGKLISNNNNEALNALNFIKPVIVNRRGYHATEMHIVPQEKIKNITTNGPEEPRGYHVNFETTPPIRLTPNNQFVRWLGL